MVFLARFRELSSEVAHHTLLSSPVIALGLSALSLLLLVLVLLSVPGPIKGLYWFSVDGEQSGMGQLKSGVLGGVVSLKETAAAHVDSAVDTSNCTYAPLSNNGYLSTKINTGEALSVRMMLPLACYWAIVTLVSWVILLGIANIGYRIKDLDSITRHLRVSVMEACVLCITLFGNVLCWLAFGLGRNAFLSVQNGGGKPKSGRAMEVTAVAALVSLLSFFFAIWGLHLRLQKAQKHWKEEAVMVRRRSMALSAQGIPFDDQGRPKSSLGVSTEKNASAPEYQSGSTYRGSMVKSPSEEEVLDNNLAEARRNSRDQEMMIRRASMISPSDTPYAAGQNAMINQ